MKIIHEPKVYLVGRQNPNWDGIYGFLQDEGTHWEIDLRHREESGELSTSKFIQGSEYLCELASRLSPMAFGDRERTHGTMQYLRQRIEEHHGTIFEMAVWNFIITGISRACSHEFVRARAGVAFVQRSQRYCSEENANFVEPGLIAEDPELHELWQRAVVHAQTSYIALVGALEQKARSYHPNLSTAERKKWARQAARSVLPNATETKIAWVVNGRALRHWLELRANRAAEPEIRRLANRVYDIMIKEATAIFQDYTKIDLGDGTFELQTSHRKI